MKSYLLIGFDLAIVVLLIWVTIKDYNKHFNKVEDNG